MDLKSIGQSNPLKALPLVEKIKTEKRTRHNNFMSGEAKRPWENHLNDPYSYAVTLSS